MPGTPATPAHRRARRRSRLLVVAAAGALVASLLAGLAPSSAQVIEDDERPGIGAGRDNPWARGQRAIEVLGDRLPAVARAYGVSPGELREMFVSDPTLAVDDNDELLYVEPAGADRIAASLAPADDAEFAPPTTDPVFSLASRPGADHTIYLDFDGHVTEGTSWNNADRPSIVSPPYDVDGSPDTWSTAEIDRIRAAFEGVAEDFAPFDVNVTTIEPPAGDLSYDGAGDTRWGVRALMTRDTAGLCGCGGVAYIGSFDDRVDEPVFVFNSSTTGLIETISHEVGHALFLAHDGDSGTTYYRGHANGGISWGPIMGASFNRTVTQWSAGDYHDANNVGDGANYGMGDDDLAIISSLTNGNGFGYVDDDHGDDAASATPVGSGTHTGLISTTDDVDLFRIVTEGGLSVSAAPSAAAPNLDVALRVLDTAGNVITTSNDPTTLAATIELPVLAGGTYLIEVDGVGWGDPLSPTPTGWTGYASLGRYSMEVVIADGPVDVDPPAAPTGLSAGAVTADAVALSWAANGEADLAGSRVLRRTTGTAWTTVASVPAGTTTHTDDTVADGTTYDYAVEAVDTSGNVSTPSSSITVTTPAGPVTPDVTSGEILVSGTVTGDHTLTWAADGRAQTITERSSGGRPNRRHDLAEHIWVIPVDDGNHVLEIDADVTDGGDADEGFELAWSSSSSGPWTTLGTLTGQQASAAFDLGAPTGTVYVRVRDTDATARETGFDSIAVDAIALRGGAPVTEAPAVVTGQIPTDGSTDVAPTTTLAWSPADRATSYRVVVSAGGAVVVDEVVGATSLAATLDPSTVHSWRVDAVNAIGTTAGPTLTFTTAAPASTMSVASLVTGTENAGKGRQRATADALVLDDRGAPVAGATVTVRFGGDIAETASGVTGSDGRVRIESTSTAKRATVTSCVSDLTGAGLTWAPGAEAC